MIRQNFRYKPAIKILDLVKADPKALLYKGSIPSLSSSGSSSPPSSLNSSTIRSPAPPSTPSTSGSSTRSSRHSDSQFSSQSPGALDLSPITSCSSLAGDTDSARSGSLSPRGSSIFDSDSDSESGVLFQLHHPSDVINEYILDKCPDINVAITHDDEWASVLEESDSQFPDKSTLISRMLDRFPSKFEQNSKDDSVLGTLTSPTLRRIDPPCRASTPRKGKSPETRAITTVALPPGNEWSNGETKMMSSWLDEYSYVGDDVNEFVSSKRRKLGSDNSLVIQVDDTQSSSEAISVKMEDPEDLYIPSGYMAYTSTYGTANHCEYFIPYKPEVATSAQSSPFSISSTWDINSVGTSTPSLISCSSGTNSPAGPSLLATNEFMDDNPSPLPPDISEPYSFGLGSGPYPSIHSTSTSAFSPYLHSDHTPSSSTSSSSRWNPGLPMGQDSLKKMIVASPAVAAAASSRRLLKSPKFACNLCPSTFTAKHNLTNHLNAHYDIRPFQCVGCSRSFGTKHVLKRHMKSCTVKRGATTRQASSTADDTKLRVTSPSVHIKDCAASLPSTDFAFVSRRSQTPSISAT